MQDPAPLPSVECPQHYVQSPHKSPEPYIVSQQSGDIAYQRSSRSLTSERTPVTETTEKLRAIWRREDLRCCVQKAGLTHDLGGELCETSKDPRYWFERAHYFARERRTIEQSIKAKAEIQDVQHAAHRDSDYLYVEEFERISALKCQSEFLAEAYNAGIQLIHPSEGDKTSRDPSYWRDEASFYIDETQNVKQMARKLGVRPVKERAMRPASPPRVLNAAEKETMAQNKQIAKENREELRYWIEKAELEVLDLGDLDESCYDPEYWRRKALFYIEETLRVQWDYRIKNMKVRGQFTVETDPETGKRYVEDFVMYDGDNGDLRHFRSLEHTPKPKAHKSHATKPRLPRKTKSSKRKAKPSKNKASRADPASRGAVSKKARANSPISSRLRNKARPTPQARSGTSR